MKSKINLLLNILVGSLCVLFSSCKDKDEAPPQDPTPDSYFNAILSLNSGSPQLYTADDYSYEARINVTADDTLMFEGERIADASYLYFNLINPDLNSFAAGDSLSIPYDINSGTTVFCSLLVHSLSNKIFQPDAGAEQGKIYIDEIDYTKKKIKGRVHGEFYSTNDTLSVTSGTFKIDL